MGTMHQLEALRSRLMAEQRDIVLRAAGTRALPPWSTILHIAQLENAIQAAEAALQQVASREM